ERPTRRHGRRLARRQHRHVPHGGRRLRRAAARRELLPHVPAAVRSLGRADPRVDASSRNLWRITTSGDLGGADDGKVDLGLRHDVHEVREHVLGDQRDDLTARGTPKTPADLATHDIIAFESIDLTNEWRFRNDKAARVTPRLTVNSADAAIAAAEAGLGITRALSYQVEATVRAGRLVALLASDAPPELPVNAIYSTRRAAAPGVAAFVAAARAHFEANIR
ncbi:MAG: hypothetical protein H7138_18760, partial [Myxococcales bacterium]|nr:hypothetical protein [Myxococcales bacterium]